MAGLRPTRTPGEMRLSPLVARIAVFATATTPLRVPYVRSYTIAAVLRPVLRAALDSGDALDVFLPKAIAAWKAAGR